MLAQAEPAGASVTELANELRPILVRLARELRKETTHLGITGGLRHAGYIENWLDLLRHDDRAIFTAASKATQAADYLRSPS